MTSYWNRERIKKQFYIDVKGKIHKWDISDSSINVDESVSLHYEIAKKLFPKLEYPEDYLFNLNWISVGSNVYGLKIKSEPSQAQINTLNKLDIVVIVDSNGNKYKIV